MRLRPLIVALLLLIGLGGAACDSAPPPGPPSPVVPTAPPALPEPAAPARPEALTLAGMRAQLLAAQALLAGGQDAAALQHAFIPQGELLPALGASPLTASLAPALQAYVDVVNRRVQNDATATDEAVAAAHATALAAIDQALAALDADLDTVPARAGLLGGLLTRAAQEYDAAVRAGGPAERGAYESAYGYLQVAREQYNALKPLVGDRHPEPMAEIEAQFAALDPIFPAVTPPPAQPPPSGEVQAAVDAINRALNEIAGVTAAPALSHADLLAGARQAVATALASVRAGQPAAAHEQATGAYLHYFAPVEGALARRDPALAAELAGHFKDLRDGIQAGKPEADLQIIVNKITAGLDRARPLIAP
jgi:hypothetical protein